jgi:hypothetical protein
MHSVFFKVWEGGRRRRRWRRQKDGLCQLTGPPCEVQEFCRGLRFSLIFENTETTGHGGRNPFKPLQNCVAAYLSTYSSDQIVY